MKKVVVKIGGSLAIDEQKLQDFVRAVVAYSGDDKKICVVHGGGKDINENIALLAEAPTFVEGLRVTTPEIMKMVEMTLSGHVNKKMVRFFLSSGGKAIGISGVDGALFEVKKREGKIDLGLVGDVVRVNPEIIYDLWKGGWTPVISPISFGNGESWNVNADTAASELAIALKADQFILISDVEGVLDASKQVVSNLDEPKVEALISDGVISGGMIPKVRESVKSLKRGLKSIHIIGWRDSETFQKQLNGELNYGSILE